MKHRNKPLLSSFLLLMITQFALQSCPGATWLGSLSISFHEGHLVEEFLHYFPVLSLFDVAAGVNSSSQDSSLLWILSCVLIFPILRIPPQTSSATCPWVHTSNSSDIPGFYHQLCVPPLIC